jgi:hypothetical protein
MLFQFVTKSFALWSAFGAQVLGLGEQIMKINLCNVFDDRVRRRCWLLAKALESAPLEEALALAKKAEEFLTGRGDASPEDVAALSAIVQPSILIH